MFTTPIPQHIYETEGTKLPQSVANQGQKAQHCVLNGSGDHYLHYHHQFDANTMINMQNIYQLMSYTYQVGMAVLGVVRLCGEVEVAAAEVHLVPLVGVVESFRPEDGTSALVACRSQQQL